MGNASVSRWRDMAMVTGRHSLAWMVLFLCLFLTGGIAAAAETNASGPPPFQMPTSGVKSGHITAKHESSVEINGTRYAFHPKVEFWTDEGLQLEWRDFNKGNEVQFHLKQERVDFLVLVQPK